MGHSISDVKALVEAFNKLPRDGDWCLSLEPIFVNGYYISALCNLSLFNPPFLNSRGRTPIVYVSDPVKQANVIVPHLLDLFVSCFDTTELESYGYGTIYPERGVAPRWWCFVDREGNYPGLAAAIQTELRALGVEEGLYAMQTFPFVSNYHDYQSFIRRTVVTKRSRETNLRLYPDLPEPVTGGPPPVFCPRCGFSIADSFGTPLSLCGGCIETWYCGVSCQRYDWGNHKKGCYEALNLLGQSQRTLDSVRRMEHDLPPLRSIEGWDLEETDSEMDCGEMDREKICEVFHEEVDYKETECEKTS
jgi:MYND finger